VYKLTNFDIQTEHIKDREIWYNPAVDIVYYGDNSCIATINSSIPKLGIRRIAINSTRKIVQCENYDYPPYGPDDGINLFQALHGFYGIEDVEEDWYGCIETLQEVFVVVQSNLCRPNAGEVDLSFRCRSATTDGLTRGQKSFKAWPHQEIARAKKGDGAWDTGVNQWVGDKIPRFHFVSLSPRSGIGSAYYDGLGINDAAAKFLLRSKAAALDDIWKGTGCRLRIPHKSLPAEDPREIGFCGNKEAIEKAKFLIVEKISESENGVVVPLSQADRVDVYEEVIENVN
jgi:hypothetical protein